MNCFYYDRINKIYLHLNGTPFVNTVITLHVFYKQLHFLLQPQVTCGHMNFQSESFRAVAYSIQF